MTMRTAVLDFGTGFTKAGFSGEEAPREVFRSCTGIPRHSGAKPTLYGHPTDVVAGDEAYVDRGLLELRWPIARGHVSDFVQLDTLLYHGLYNRLAVAPDTTPCLMLEPADQTRQSREKTAELLFETFNVPLVGFLNSATATVYSTGRTTGIAVDSGAGKTMVAAVCDGYALAHTMRPSAVAGNSLTDDLFSFLRGRGYPLSVQADWELANSMKERLCRTDTAAQLQEEEDSGTPTPPPQPQPQQPQQYPGKTDGGAYYELPDNERIFLLEAETRLAERLFDPSVGLDGSVVDCEAPRTPTGYTASNPALLAKQAAQGKGDGGWADAVCAVAAACPSPSMRAELFGNIVLGGGTTLLRDVERRLQRELSVRKPRPAEDGDDVVAKVAAFPHRAQAAWIGGSVWSCSPAFPGLCFSKTDYYEGGANSVHRHAF